MGVCLEEVEGRKLLEIDFLFVLELVVILNGEISIVWLNDLSIYKCIYFLFVDCGFQYFFYLMEGLIDEVMKVEKKVYEKVICMIVYEVNNIIVGIIFILDMVEQVLFELEGMEDICDVMCVCIECCFFMSYFIICFVDVVKIFEFCFILINLNDFVFICKCFMEGMCNDWNIWL